MIFCHLSIRVSEASVLNHPHRKRVNLLRKFPCACCPPRRWPLNKHIVTSVLQILLLSFHSNCLFLLLGNVTSCLQFNWDSENCSKTWLLQASKTSLLSALLRLPLLWLQVFICLFSSQPAASQCFLSCMNSVCMSCVVWEVSWVFVFS